MSETTVVDARLDKLEQDNRRLKLTVGALLLALAAVPLIGAVMPEQIPELIRAQAFEVVDPRNGVLRARMADLGIFYYDGFGNYRVGMSDLGIAYRGENGTVRAAMHDDGFWYRDENGIPRVIMADDGISYWDENGIIRAELGRVELTTPSTGAETTYPAQVVLYDDDNNVIWSAVGGR